jgi:hypothetical protein
MNSTDWLNSLKSKRILNLFQVNDKEFYRINTEAKFTVSKVLVKQIQDDYDSSNEKGGMILFQPSQENGITVFIAKEVVFIQNNSDTPCKSYLIDADGKSNCIKYAFANQLLPFEFHTHPTKSQNYLGKFMNYMNQLGTSDNDQMHSLFDLKVGNINLRLPEILVVGNGSDCLDVFIGFYNGLICPTTFVKHKEELVNKAQKKTRVFVDNNVDSNTFWIVLSVVVVAGIFLSIKYPKTIIPLIVGAVVVIPLLVYSTQSKNEFFGISRGDNLDIWIPRIDDGIILANEIEAIKKLKKYREEQKKKDEEKNERELQAVG